MKRLSLKTFAQNSFLIFSTFLLCFIVHSTKFERCLVLLHAVLDSSIRFLSRFDVGMIAFYIKYSRVLDVYLFRVLKIGMQMEVTILMELLTNNSFFKRTYILDMVPYSLSRQRALRVSKKEALSIHTKNRFLFFRNCGIRGIMRCSIRFHNRIIRGLILIHKSTNFCVKIIITINQAKALMPFEPLYKTYHVIYTRPIS